MKFNSSTLAKLILFLCLFVALGNVGCNFDKNTNGSGGGSGSDSTEADEDSDEITPDEKSKLCHRFISGTWEYTDTLTTGIMVFAYDHGTGIVSLNRVTQDSSPGMTLWDSSVVVEGSKLTISYTVHYAVGTATYTLVLNYSNGDCEHLSGTKTGGGGTLNIELSRKA